MKITKEDIERSIHEYNKAIKKLEDAGINHDNYTVTISHARWIKLLTMLKTHVEAWEKVREEIKCLSNSVYNATEFNKSRGLDIALEIINEHLSELRGDTDGKDADNG